MHLELSNQKVQNRLGSVVAGNSLAKRNVGLTVKNNKSQQDVTAAIKASQILSCIFRGITNRGRDVIIPLYSVFVSSDPKCCVQFWSPQFQKDVDRMEQVQGRAIIMVKGPNNLP